MKRSAALSATQFKGNDALRLFSATICARWNIKWRLSSETTGYEREEEGTDLLNEAIQNTAINWLTTSNLLNGVGGNRQL